MCRSCEEYEHELTKTDRDRLLGLGEAMAQAIANGVRELPRGGISGQIANNPAEVAASENWKAFRSSLDAWRDYMGEREH